MQKPTILVTGALGQIGRVLVHELCERYGKEAVLATDLPESVKGLPCSYMKLDATKKEAWDALAAQFQFTSVYHLVAVLSAKGEQNPWQSWDINMKAWRNALQTAQKWQGCRVFFPSSIAVYGPPLPQVVDETQALNPSTSYGISKSAGEQWAHYCYLKYGVDTRTLRLPGVIGYQTLPGGGTTDYAVTIYHHAVKGEPFTCFLKPDTALPMIYMDDLLRGILELMETPREKLGPHSNAVYNLSGFTTTPQMLAACIKQLKPGFEINYVPDFRQAIAESWPAELLGNKAHTEWGWIPQFDEHNTTSEMLTHLQEMLSVTPTISAT